MLYQLSYSRLVAANVVRRPCFPISAVPAPEQCRGRNVGTCGQCSHPHVRSLSAGSPKLLYLPPQSGLRGVAQSGRVLRSGRRSRRFESSHPDQCEALATKLQGLFHAHQVVLSEASRGGSSVAPPCRNARIGDPYHLACGKHRSRLQARRYLNRSWQRHPYTWSKRL